VLGLGLSVVIMGDVVIDVIEVALMEPQVLLVCILIFDLIEIKICEFLLFG
jgi:hypothetical protein